MKKEIPIFIVFFIGTIGFLQYFIVGPLSKSVYTLLLEWFQGVQGMAIIMAVISLTRRHFHNLKRGKNVFYSFVTLVSLYGMIILGVFFGIGKGSTFDKIYEYVMVPLNATTFSLLAFYMASASYRAFRARNLESTLLLLSAFILMIGFTSFGDIISDKLPSLAQWILDVPNLAAQRGITLGIALGILATSLKIMLGIERSWLE
ncbi:MAG: hypothetical protein ABDH37_06450 [Candidatus Hydrothermales bacterium]